jgi:hypothetical protein
LPGMLSWPHFVVFSSQKRYERHVEIKTPDLMVKPDKTARVWGKATQYRRTNDCIWETFRVPIVNPEIKVSIDENEFSHDVQFGTYGDRSKAEYSNHYTLSGVYFPGQYMFVRWWPRRSAPKDATACPPELPVTAADAPVPLG